MGLCRGGICHVRARVRAAVSQGQGYVGVYPEFNAGFDILELKRLKLRGMAAL